MIIVFEIFFDIGRDRIFIRREGEKAFEHFSKEYCLEENGLEIESLRQIYYREKKTNLLFRLQSKSANRVVNYC
jgi:hypothetical protein